MLRAPNRGALGEPWSPEISLYMHFGQVGNKKLGSLWPRAARWGRIARGALGPWRASDRPCLGESAFCQPTGGRNPPENAKGACAAQLRCYGSHVTSLAELLLRLRAVTRLGNACKISQVILQSQVAGELTAHNVDHLGCGDRQRASPQPRPASWTSRSREAPHSSSIRST